MTDNFYSKVYRKKTLKRIYKKYKLLGKDAKLNYISFMNIRVILTFLLFIILFFKSKGYIYVPLITILFYFAFENILDYKIKKRASRLNYQAIFYFQVLVLSLESGRTLRSAIELTSQNIDNEITINVTPGEIATFYHEEFKKTLHEVDLGKSLTNALEDMKERIPSEEINTVLLNITQSTIFGNNIIESLNNQIEYLRDKKLLNIRARINKMPLKISIVSVFFIIPIIMLLVLGPVIIEFILTK